MKQNQLILYFLLFLSLILYLVGFLFSYDYLIDDLSSSTNRLGAIRSIAEYGVMYSSFILFTALLYKNKYTKIIALLLIFFVSINSFISYCAHFIYGSGFNIGMAVSVLDSNLDEAANMVTGYIAPLSIALLLFVINFIIILRISKYSFKPYFKIFAFVWIILPVIFLLKQNFIGAKGGGPMVKNVFYHFKDFKSAYDLQQRMDGIKNHKVKYSYKKTHEGAETIVVMIGESGRKQNMSLYGYSRDTTPEQVKEKENMYLFKNANSPAGITNLSLPLTLSMITSERFESHSEDMADNIINLANNYGYYTTWISAQNNIKGVTEIASYSKMKTWVNGYDPEILPKLKESLQKKGKKLIVLHINGSHPNPCLRYPESGNNFNDNNEMDCYDNSIHYTDQLIGNILKNLKGKNAAFIYFTDHGLKLKDDKLIHSDSKESSTVPFYIWFGRKEEQNSFVFNKSQEEQISTAYLYPLVMNLIGLNEIKLDKVENNTYFLLDHSSILYKDLKD